MLSCLKKAKIFIIIDTLDIDDIENIDQRKEQPFLKIGKKA